MEKFEKVIICLCVFGICTAEEPKCSRFDFEKNLLEMLVRLEFKMDKMTEKVAEIEDRVGTLEEKQHGQDAAILNVSEESQIKVAKIETRFGIIEERQDKHDVAISNASNALQNRILDLTTLVNMINKTVPRVGFFAISPISDVVNQRPTFQTLLYNDGDSYNVSTGIFTCRVAGLYHFTFTFLCNSDSSSARSSLNINNSELLYTLAKGHYHSATMTVYHNLNVGDTVDVMCSGWQNIHYGRNSMFFIGTFIRL